MRPAKARKTSPWPPVTVSRSQLLAGGRDDDFRKLVDDMLKFANVLQDIRGRLARHLDVSPPQYSMIMHLARCEACECTTTQLARSLEVTLPFVVVETGKLATLGLVERRRNPQDARSVLIALTEEGRARLKDAAPLIRDVNDRLFASLSREGMAALAEATAGLLADSESAFDLLAPTKVSKQA